MPDDLDDMLSGLARAVGANVQPPPGERLRQRSARHLARRRVTASVLAVGLVGLAGGTAAVVASNRGAGAPVTSNSATRTSAGPAPSISVSPAPSPDGSATASTSSPTASTTPDSTIPASGTTGPAAPPNTSASTSSGSGTVSLSALVGLWKPADGEERALVVLPDGDIGMGQAGGQFYPMCAGQLGTESDGSFPVNVACSDWGTSGLTLSVAGADLVLHVPATGGGPSTQVTWVRVSEPATLPADGTALPSWLIGNWGDAGDPAGETFDISADGTMTWTLVTQSGQTQSGTARVYAVGDGQYTASTTIGGDGELWVFAGLDNGQLLDIGGYGTVDFTKAQ